MRIRLRTVIWGLVIIIGVAIASPFLFFAFYLITSGDSNSKEEAVRLKAIVESIPDPKSGEGIHREYAYKQFKNGEWILGIGRDSHAWMSKYRGGGVMVVKDNKGKVRCFFGHVCGPDALEMHLGGTKSVDDFYTKMLTGKEFTEYQWP